MIVRQDGITDEPPPEELRVSQGCGFRAGFKTLSLTKLAEAYLLPAIAVDISGVLSVCYEIRPPGGQALLVYNMLDAICCLGASDKRHENL